MAEATMMPSQRFPSSHVARLGGLITELDPQNEYGPRKIWAALKSLGLEPEDVDPARELVIKVSDKIPSKEKAEQVKEHRRTVFKGLQDSRLQELRRVLKSLTEDDVRRFEKTGDGIRPVRPDDLPQGDALEMNGFEEMQQKRYARLKAEQQRKANLLATGFLQEKKRQEDAEAKVEALEQRLKEYKKQQAETMKLKKKEAEKKAEKREQGSQKAAQERAAWEDETEENLLQKLKKAKEARDQIYSKDNLRAKMEASDSRRLLAFDQAVALEAELLQRIETKQESLDGRLEARRQQVAAELQAKREASQAKFQNRQIRVYSQKQEWAKTMLEQHGNFEDHFKKAQTTGRTIVLQKAKSCAELVRKASDKWKANYEKIVNAKKEDTTVILEKLAKAKERVEAVAALKLKNDHDIFSVKEVKDGTWGELQKRRMREFKKAQEAQAQALIFKVGENCAKAAIEDEGKAELQRRRQAIGKESLALSDKAREGFNKIQAESDERKIVKIMSEMGFKMPKLPDPDEEADKEDGKAAY